MNCYKMIEVELCSGLTDRKWVLLPYEINHVFVVRIQCNVIMLSKHLKTGRYMSST